MHPTSTLVLALSLLLLRSAAGAAASLDAKACEELGFLQPSCGACPSLAEYVKDEGEENARDRPVCVRWGGGALSIGARAASTPSPPPLPTTLTHTLTHACAYAALVAECTQCCVPDEGDAAAVKYAKAVLEVCTFKLK
jgi:hypothetical protein